MGGVIDWQALPVLIEMYGIEDVETLLRQLITIRNHQTDALHKNMQRDR